MREWGEKRVTEEDRGARCRTHTPSEHARTRGKVADAKHGVIQPRQQTRHVGDDNEEERVLRAATPNGHVTAAALLALSERHSRFFEPTVHSFTLAYAPRWQRISDDDHHLRERRMMLLVSIILSILLPQSPAIPRALNGPS